MARDTSTRYQNALTYGPGRAVGFYPDAGWQGSGGSAQTQTFAPATFAPLNALASQPGATTQQQAPGYGVAPLAGMAAMFGIDRLGSYLTSNLNAPDLTPSDPYTGSTGMAVDPNADYGGAVDTALAQSSIPTAAGEVSTLPIAVQGDAGMGVDTALAAAQMAPAEGWGAGASMASDVVSGLDSFWSNLDFDPISIGAGMLGSWGGSTLGNSLVEGDAEQQPVAGQIGGSVGGALGSYFGGPVGRLFGSFLGSLAGSTLGAGSPDIPYSWGNTFLGHDGLTVGDSGSGNHMKSTYAQNLNNQLAGVIQQRAAADGLQFDPYYAGEGYNVGTYRNQLTYQPTGLGAAPAGANQYTWQGSSPQDLGNYAYQDLMSRGILTSAPRITMQQYDDDYQNRWNTYNAQFGPNGELPMMTQTGAEGITYEAPGTPTAPDLTYSGWSNQYYGSFPAGVASEDISGGDAGGAGGGGGGG